MRLIGTASQKCSTITFIAFVTLLSLGKPAAAQVDTFDKDGASPNTELFWLSASAGFYSPLIGAGMNAEFSWGKNSLCARATAASAWDKGPITAYALYYGRQQSTPGTLTRAAVGLAFVDGYMGPRVHGFGLSAECEGMLKTGFIGIGLTFSLTYTPSNMYFGLLMNVSLGKLR